jgi:hypothetical protein
LDDAMAEAAANLERTAAQIARTLALNAH